jgi:hypothetical protein
MTNEIQNKLKEFIDFTCLKDFEIIDYEKHAFIPLGKKDDMFFIAMLDSQKQAEIQKFVSPILGDTKYKIILINQETFNELINYIKYSYNAQIEIKKIIIKMNRVKLLRTKKE